MLFLFTEKRYSRRLLTAAAVLLAVTLGASPALARGHGRGGGHWGGDRGFGYSDHDHDPASDIYASPGLKITTASQVGGLPDGKGALLKGHIIGQVGPDQYLFRDSTGTSTVLMSQSDWNSLQAGASDLVEIHGKAVSTNAGMSVQEERIATIPN